MLTGLALTMLVAVLGGCSKSESGIEAANTGETNVEPPSSPPDGMGVSGDETDGADRGEEADDPEGTVVGAPVQAVENPAESLGAASGPEERSQVSAQETPGNALPSREEYVKACVLKAMSNEPSTHPGVWKGICELEYNGTVAPVVREVEACARAKEWASRQTSEAFVDPQSRVVNPPRYPGEERRRGIQGTVVLIVSVDKCGLVVDVAVEESSGNRNLDREAVSAARRWEYTPSLKDGQASAGTVRVPVTFKLTGSE